MRLYKLFVFINNLNNLQFTMKIGNYDFANPQAFHNLISMSDFDVANELKGDR